MKQSTKRFLSMILSLFFLVGAFIIYFQFIQPLYGDVQTVRSEMESRQNFLAQQKEAIQKVQQLIGVYQGQGDLQQKVSQVIPTSTDTVGAIAQLNGLASNSRIRIDSLSLGAPMLVAPNVVNTAAGQFVTEDSFTKPLGMVTIQMKLSGTYQDFKDFVAKLETNLRIFEVKTLTIVPSGKNGVSNPYAYDLAVVVYYQSL